MTLPSASHAAIMPSHGGRSSRSASSRPAAARPAAASSHSVGTAGRLSSKPPPKPILRRISADRLSSKPPPKPILRRIDNPSHRQFTFSRYRNSLLKKACELSVLCDAEVATIIFSSTGRVSEFSSPSMSKIIERYEDLQSQNSNKIVLQEKESWNHESLELRKQVGYLNNSQSYMMGEDAMSLSVSVSELQKIESQLELTMNKIKAQKIYLDMLDGAT